MFCSIFTQEIEATEEKLRVELERLQYAIAERESGSSSPATIEKKELQDDGKLSDLSSSHDMSALEEQELQSIKIELVRFTSHANHHYISSLCVELDRRGEFNE